MCRSLLITITLCACMLTACTGTTTFRSSVPAYPIHLEINTNVGTYVHFVPENVSAYLIADAKGIHFNGQTMPLTVTEAYGYAGTVVYIDGFHPYGAYDLCCPHCLKRETPCVVDGIFAVCPICGEEFDIYSGNGVPTHGIAKEALRPYRTTYDAANGKLLVTQLQ